MNKNVIMIILFMKQILLIVNGRKSVDARQMQIDPVSKQHTTTGGERAEHLGVQRLLVTIECGVKDEAHGGSIGGPLPQESTNPAMRPAWQVTTI